MKSLTEVTPWFIDTANAEAETNISIGRTLPLRKARRMISRNLNTPMADQLTISEIVDTFVPHDQAIELVLEVEFGAPESEIQSKVLQLVSKLEALRQARDQHDIEELRRVIS